MLTQDELVEWTARFGVAPEQIKKDHLISHVLWAIATSPTTDGTVFIGGTGLARTHLTDLRVSEDIDLWSERAQRLYGDLLAELPDLLRREYPAVLIRASAGTTTAGVVAQDGTSVRLQIIAFEPEYSRCLPLENHSIDLRYSDVPDPIELLVPERSSFAATKHLAWVERHAPRDLVDLAGLAALGALNTQADKHIECVRGFGVGAHEVRELPRRTHEAWAADLGHQMGNVPDPYATFEAVRRGWADGLGWDN